MNQNQVLHYSDPVAIDLIVQHIRDFLNHCLRHGSPTNIAYCTNAEHEHSQSNGIGFRGSTAACGGGDPDTFMAIRRYSSLCKELSPKENAFFGKNKKMTQH